MKRKIGDPVTIRSDLEVGTYDGIFANLEMCALKGRKAKIVKVGVATYGLDIFNGYVWTDEMFEDDLEQITSVEDLQVGDRITFKKGIEEIIIRINDGYFTTINEGSFEKEYYKMTNNFNYSNSDYDIIKVEHPNYTTIYEVQKRTMTKEEAEKEFDIEVVR